MRAYFVAQLRAVSDSSPHPDTTFQNKVGTFLESVELFIDLLLCLREIPEDQDWIPERILAYHRLMQFVLSIGRRDLYIRFTHQCIRLCLENNDHLRAGMAVKRHADLYDWAVVDDRLDVFQEGQIALPSQSSFDRKEALYYHAMGYFGLFLFLERDEC
jgi:dedicator of cytokinesis protein 3